MMAQSKISPNTGHKLKPWQPKSKQPTTNEYENLNKQLLMSSTVTILLWALSLAAITLVLGGCNGGPMVVQPCPSLPSPPASLMEVPKTVDLIPPHLRPTDMPRPVNKSSPTVLIPPVN